MNRIIIKILLVVIVLVSCLFNGVRQLNGRVNDLKDIFLNGENNDQLSIHYDLVKIDDSLSYFLSLSNKYTSNDYTQSLDVLHKDFKYLESIEEYSQWYDEVKDLYPKAISELKDMNLTKQHQTMLNKYEATLNSAIHTISYASFNQEVRDYQEDTNNLLGNLMKSFIQGVDTFD